MWRIFIVFVVITSYTAQASVLRCGPKELFDDCPSHCHDSCPTRDGELKNCGRSVLDKCPTPKCVCQFNYRRATNGTCIRTTLCPVFECTRPNEVYDPCPVYCPMDDCREATPDGKCRHRGLLLVRECLPACRCKPTYWRKEGVCVPYQECDHREDFVILIPLTSDPFPVEAKSVIRMERHH